MPEFRLSPGIKVTDVAVEYSKLSYYSGGIAHLHCELPSGKKEVITRDFMERSTKFDANGQAIASSRMGVAALLYDPKHDAVVLVRQPRAAAAAAHTNLTTEFGLSTEIISGYVDAGETPLQAMHREVSEESALQVLRVQEIATDIQITSDIDPGVYHLYYAEVNISRFGKCFDHFQALRRSHGEDVALCLHENDLEAGITFGHKLENEYIEVILETRASFLAKVDPKRAKDAPAYHDSKTVMAALWLAEHADQLRFNYRTHLDQTQLVGLAAFARMMQPNVR